MPASPVAFVPVLASSSLGGLGASAGGYASVMVINQDHYVPHIIHDAGTHELTTEDIGTPFAMIGTRILVNLADPTDIAAVNGPAGSVHIRGSRRANLHPSCL